MIEKNKKIEKILEELDDKEKIRVFYELGKYFLVNMDYNELDHDMQNLLDDIANVINDVEKL